MAKANGTWLGASGLAPAGMPAEVLAIVSHDLKVPLSAISMGASLLADEAQTLEQRAQMVELIKRAIRRMERLIGDLLETVHLDAGQTLRIRPASVDLPAVLAEVIETLRPAARGKSQALECETAPALPPVYADRDRLWQVLANLVGNAVKFTPRGGRIVLGARPDGDAVRLSVADTGAGIAPEDLPKVFDPFWQAQKTASLGSGLGLKIARAIVEAHGGRMWVDSAPGAGTTFSFTLPCAAAEGVGPDRSDGLRVRPSGQGAEASVQAQGNH